MFKAYIFHFPTEQLKAIEPCNGDNAINQFAQSLPDGVYTTMRTVQKTKIFQLSFHLKRLMEGFELTNTEFEYDINRIKPALFNIIKQHPAKENRIRIHIPFSSAQDCYFMVEELTTPSESAYNFGVRVITNSIFRSNPEAKLSSFLRESENLKNYLINKNIEEALMVNNSGEILEGLSSNFFAFKGDELYTAEKGILFGSTRDVILRIAESNRMKIVLLPIKIFELNDINEAFIASTSRGIIPVVEIDELQIGSGSPGKNTLFLQNQINDWMWNQSEKIIQSED